MLLTRSQISSPKESIRGILFNCFEKNALVLIFKSWRIRSRGYELSIQLVLNKQAFHRNVIRSFYVLTSKVAPVSPNFLANLAESSYIRFINADSRKSGIY